MTWHDLRDWIDGVDALGQLRVVDGASWQEDIGRITEMLDHTPGSPCVLFDNIPGYPRGWRVIANANGTTERRAWTLDMAPEDAHHEGLLARWEAILNQLEPRPPDTVSTGPVSEAIAGSAVTARARIQRACRSSPRTLIMV